MKLNVLLYRPYQSHFRACIFDAAGIGKNLLSGRALTSEVSAMTTVSALLNDRYGDVEVHFDVQESDHPGTRLNYRLPSGKVVTVP